MNPDEDKKNYWEKPEGSQEQPTPEVETPDNPEEQAPEGDLSRDTDNAQPDNTDTPVTWTAQEYVHIDKSPMWFVIFIFVVLALIAIDLLFLKSYTFSALVIVMAVAVIIYTRRPPRALTYALSIHQGLYVGEKLYHLDEFKSFGLIKDGEHHSIMLIPRKRFSLGVSVYFPEEAGEQIVDILGKRLPMEDLKLDVIDVVVRKLRL
ncbi:MAG: hypothetical protein EOT05_01365 [Candidatus Microsaccharimonas sossegonensis]|uniref:DUF5673 domain-containing protein n=1 Tax=Candidatus Microsaccharimonas sossegonensis TaxID=2506948 RepID=A0A4Q0AH28_9BACT|nr:MAG: hypothetical protein EOT05_01365 [Candidatus Microsaccharimonas sossegonensis]